MKFHIISILIFCLMMVGHPARAQQGHPQYAAVMAVVDQFFASINNGDGELLASLEVEGAQILNVREDSAGEFAFAERDWFGADNFAGGSSLTERYWDDVLMVSDHVAVFWAPYDLHVDGEFSHCGIDVLNLIKQNDQWKIGHAMWTVQRTGCAPSPLGPLAESAVPQ